MRMDVAAIIQARLGSTRLPGKVMIRIEKKPVLGHIIYRVGRSKMIDGAMVATTTLKEDSKIARYCAKKGVKVYRGSENDVLDRYFQAARTIGARHIVRITADCPIIDPGIIDKVVRRHLSGKADYTCNTLKEAYPDGQDVEVFKYAVLEKAWQNARLTSEREHVTAYIRKNGGIFKILNVECNQDHSSKRWTLDEKKDLDFIKAVYAHLYKKNKAFGMDDVLKLLKEHPELEKINKGITRNEGYLKSLKQDRVSAAV